MAISRSSLDSIPTSFATTSLGVPSDPLDKLSAISSARFQAIELSFPDLVSFASAHLKKEVKTDDFDSLCEAGEAVRNHGLQIMMLQSLTRFEGWDNRSTEKNEAFERAKGWIRIMQSVGTGILQVGSSDAAGISTETGDIIGDLRELADMLAKHQFRLADENLS